MSVVDIKLDLFLSNTLLFLCLQRLLVTFWLTKFEMLNTYGRESVSVSREMKNVPHVDLGFLLKSSNAKRTLHSSFVSYLFWWWRVELSAVLLTCNSLMNTAASCNWCLHRYRKMTNFTQQEVQRTFTVCKTCVKRTWWNVR